MSNAFVNSISLSSNITSYRSMIGLNTQIQKYCSDSSVEMVKNESFLTSNKDYVDVCRISFSLQEKQI